MGVNILDFNGKCPICNKEIDVKKEFRDIVSVREYFISGLCQECQDKVFDTMQANKEEEKTNKKNQIPFEENVKRVKEALSKVIKDIESKIPKEVFDFKDFYIAGGCIYSIWNNKLPKDYDIFCKNKKALSKIKRYFEKHICNFKSKNAITYGKYQFITKWCGDADKEVNKFDFKHNMFYYDDDGLHNVAEWDYLDSNSLVFNDLRARDVSSVVTRIPKFVARGMDIDNEQIGEMLDIITSPRNYIKERVSIKRIKSKGRSGY